MRYLKNASAKFWKNVFFNGNMWQVFGILCCFPSSLFWSNLHLKFLPISFSLNYWAWSFFSFIRVWLFICCKTKLKKKNIFEKIFVFYKIYIICRKKCFYMEKKFNIEKKFYWKKTILQRKIQIKMWKISNFVVNSIIWSLKLVSAIFIKFLFFQSPSKTMKNAFYFI